MSIPIPVLIAVGVLLFASAPFLGAGLAVLVHDYRNRDLRASVEAELDRWGI